MNCLWLFILLFCCGNNSGRDNGNCGCNRERENTCKKENTCERECVSDRDTVCERESSCGCVEPCFEARPFMNFGNTTCGCEMTQNSGCECRQ